MRVVKPDGILAASAYNLLHIEPAIDEVVNRYYYEVVGPFWPPERKLVEQFADLPFPFHEIDTAEVRNDSALDSRSSARLSCGRGLRLSGSSLRMPAIPWNK